MHSTLLTSTNHEHICLSKRECTIDVVHETEEAGGGGAAHSTTKDYFRAENKFPSISLLFSPQVIILQVSFSHTTTLSNISQRNQHDTPHFLFHKTYQSPSEVKIISTISKQKSRKKSSTCFGAYLCSEGESRHSLLVIASDS